jgi:hypothetical protein
MSNPVKPNPVATAVPADGPRVQGLSKREYFAALAMQGLLGTPGANAGHIPLLGGVRPSLKTIRLLAEVAVDCADALRDELSRGRR